MIVIDASVVVDIVTASERSALLRGRLQDTQVFAPYLIDLEVLHSIRRQQYRGLISLARCAVAVVNLQSMVILRHPHEPLIDRIWELRNNLTAYDAAYVALAETLGATLITRDARMARSSGHEARIEYVE